MDELNTIDFVFSEIINFLDNDINYHEEKFTLLENDKIYDYGGIIIHIDIYFDEIFKNKIYKIFILNNIESLPEQPQKISRQTKIHRKYIFFKKYYFNSNYLNLFMEYINGISFIEITDNFDESTLVISQNPFILSNYINTFFYNPDVKLVKYSNIVIK